MRFEKAINLWWYITPIESKHDYALTISAAHFHIPYLIFKTFFDGIFKFFAFADQGYRYDFE